MLIDDVITRIEGAVPDLAGRIEGATELSALVRDNALPQVTPAAYVLPLGLSAAEPDVSAGLYRQMVDETVGVILVLDAAGDATGGAALPALDTLIAATIAAIAGWAPGDQVGVFRLQRGELLSVNGGTVVYQIEFTIQDQLRIAA